MLIPISNNTDAKQGQVKSLAPLRSASAAQTPSQIPAATQELGKNTGSSQVILGYLKKSAP